MKVRELVSLLDRFDFNTEIDANFTAIKNKTNGHLILVSYHKAEELIKSNPTMYEWPW